MIDTSKPSEHYIFDRKFLCVIPQLDLTSTEYLRIFGSHTTGNSLIDRELSNQPITTYKSINEMVELYKKGAVIRLPKSQDCRFIYECIEYHIRTWANIVQTSMNRCDAPIDDLLALDNMANTLYPYVMRERDVREIDNSFVRYLNDSKFNITEIIPAMNKNEGITVVNVNDSGTNNEDKQEAQRQSYADVFLNRDGARQWK